MFLGLPVYLWGCAGRSYPSRPTPRSRSDGMAAKRGGASESRPSASSWVPSDACRRVPAARAERHRRRRRVRTATARPDDAMGSRITACGSGLPRHDRREARKSCLPLVATAKAGLPCNIHTHTHTHIYIYIDAIYVYILYRSCLPLLANAKAGLRWDIYIYIYSMHI